MRFAEHPCASVWMRDEAEIRLLGTPRCTANVGADGSVAVDACRDYPTDVDLVCTHVLIIASEPGVDAEKHTGSNETGIRLTGETDLGPDYQRPSTGSTP